MNLKAITTAMVVSFTAVGFAAPINVLWYGVDDAYNAGMQQLATQASAYDPAGDGSLEWNLSFWNEGDILPDFENYDVFVIGSGGSGFFSSFDKSRLLSASSDISDARGSRTFLSGQDADWHVINGSNPQADGFLINAVNWAASGSGLGIVSLTDGWEGDGGNWWLDDNSFLRDELIGNVRYFQDEGVIIPDSTSDFPVNEGLTTAGLSNWSVSSHSGFLKNGMPGYLSINDAGSNSDYSVTVVTADHAGGGTDGGDDPVSVPEPSTLIFLGSSFLGLIMIRRKR